VLIKGTYEEIDSKRPDIFREAFEHIDEDDRKEYEKFLEE
jgi:hypothetical protein